MLKFGNKEFRNLQEQVAKNMRDIQNIMQGTTVLAEFGIKVIGQVDTAMELPDPATYEGEYGDAYIVGTEEPYEYYIFTRAFEGQDEPSWFDLGIFPVPGPQGEQGPEGPAGPQGQTGATGQDGTSAGFGTVSATATTLPAGSDATVSVVASGPNTEKSFAFTFGIPEGEQGSSAEAEWGSISGDLSDQTDLVSALQAKQNASNAMTTNTEQTVSAKKTFANPVEFTTSDVTYGNGTVTTIPGTIRTDKTNNYGVNIPSTSSFAANKTLATTDQLFSGSYNDLTDKPSIPTVSGTNDGTNWTSITIDSDTYAIPQGGGTGTITDVEVNGVSVVTAGVAEVTVPTDTSDLNNDSGFITSSDIPVTDVEVDGTSVLDGTVAKITMPDLSDYVTSTELSTELADYTPTANLAAVATSGDYDDLLNKPTIPAAQVNSDWDAVSGVAQILNKPSLATVATSGSYNDLSNTPTIPTATSDLNNDSGFITSSALSGYAQLASGTSSAPQEFTGYNTFTHTLNTALIVAGGNIRPASNTTYSLGNAQQRWDRLYVDNYIMNYSKLKTNNSDSYGVVCPDTSSYVADKTIATTDQIPSLTGYATETWVTNQGYSTFSGSYTDLTDKPTIPTDTSDLTNGAGFITSSAISNMVTTDTDQTITGVKTFNNNLKIGGYYPIVINRGSQTGIKVDEGNNEPLQNILYCDISTNRQIHLGDPTYTYDITLGRGSNYSTKLNRNSNSYGLLIPSTTSWTANKTIATTDDIPSLTGYATETWVGQQGYAVAANLATVATSGDYDDLLNKPTIPTVPVQDVTVDGVSVVSSGTAAITMPTIPTSLPIETLTTEPSEAYTGPGLKLVYLSAEPTAKYAGYIYMIAES